MLPWTLYWSPRINFPWSGNWSQNIDPDINWFTSHIPRSAGNAKIESKAFQVASYGRQLGWIEDILLSHLKNAPTLSPKAQDSLKKLSNAHQQIEQLKQHTCQDAENRLQHIWQKAFDSEISAEEAIIHIRGLLLGDE